MDKIEFIKVTGIDGVEVEHAIIYKNDNEYVSMHKSTYDEMVANQNEVNNDPR